MKPIIAITTGDTNGVGYEVIIKALLTGYVFEIMRPVIYGNAVTAKQHIQSLGEDYRNITWNIIDSPEQAKDSRLNLIKCYPDNVEVQFGQNTEASNMAAKASLERACADLKAGKVQAIVTAPLNKEALQGGHTEYLAEYFGIMDNGQWTKDKNDPTKQTNPSSFSETVHRPLSESLMMLCSGNLRVALVCNHVPIADIPAQITEERIMNKLTLLNKSLLRDFGLDKPRIAVLALNPHAGDQGLLGKEEQEIIAPAVEKAREQGMWVFGPYAADGFFGSERYRQFDAVLAMYHDQGLIPFKTLDMSGVNFTAGLPIVRTSPDHGTGYDIAGKDEANEASMRNALFMAIDVLRQREAYDALTANPLPFIEHSDGEGKPRREFIDFKTTTGGNRFGTMDNGQRTIDKNELADNI